MSYNFDVVPVTLKTGSSGNSLGGLSDPIRVDPTGTTSQPVVSDRPSQKTGRVYKQAVSGAQTTNQTLYTVTSLKTLYVTTINISSFNSSTSSAGHLQIRDSSTNKISVSVPIAGIGPMVSMTTANVTSISFPEPKQFSTDFNIFIASGNITYSVDFTGYEE